MWKFLRQIHNACKYCSSDWSSRIAYIYFTFSQVSNFPSNAWGSKSYKTKGKRKSHPFWNAKIQVMLWCILILWSLQFCNYPLRKLHQRSNLAVHPGKSRGLIKWNNHLYETLMISYGEYVCFHRRSTYSPVFLKIFPIIQNWQNRLETWLLKVVYHNRSMYSLAFCSIRIERAQYYRRSSHLKAKEVAFLLWAFWMNESLKKDFFLLFCTW